MSRRSSSIDEKQLDNDIHSLKSQISKLTSELKKKEKQQEKLNLEEVVMKEKVEY